MFNLYFFQEQSKFAIIIKLFSKLLKERSEKIIYIINN